VSNTETTSNKILAINGQFCTDQDKGLTLGKRNDAVIVEKSGLVSTLRLLADLVENDEFDLKRFEVIKAKEKTV
jgi:hypothetical protein